MGGPRIRVPLFVTCSWEPCGKVVQVPSRRIQQTQKFCSPACGYKGRRKAGGFTLAQMSKGGIVRGQRARAKLLTRVAGLTPVEAFRVGYVTGLRSKLRQLTKQRLRGREAA